MNTRHKVAPRRWHNSHLAVWVLASNLLLSAGWARAEVAVQAWVRRYSQVTDSADQARKVLTDNAGNVIVAGSTYDGITADDMLVIKYSGAGVPLWTNRYNGPANGSEFAADVAVDSSGNVFVTGHSENGGLSDYATIAYSGAGVPLWTNRYNGPGNSYNYANAVAVDGSGDVFVTGTSSGSNGYPNYATIAYSGAGVPLWTNCYDGPWNSYNQALALAVDGNGNVVVTGSSFENDRGTEYATIKYLGSGVPLWTNFYHVPGKLTDAAYAVAVDSSGNVFVTGHSENGGFSDYATIAYSGAGVPLWTNRYNGPANGQDVADAVAVNGSGDVFVTGYSSGSGSSDENVTIAYSGAGVPLWTNRYNGADSPAALAVDASGNVFVTGTYATLAYSGTGVPLWTNGYNGQASAIAVDGSGNVFVTGTFSSDGNADFATVGYSGTGIPLWTNRYNGPRNSYDRAYAVAPDGSGNVFVAGFSNGKGSSEDYAMLKYSGEGVPLWTNRYNGPGNGIDRPYAIAVDGSGNLIVAGISADSNGLFGYATLKYSGTGLPLWTNRYDGPGNYDNQAYAVAVDGSGNVFVTGSSYGDAVVNADYATIKYSGAGVPLWTNRYDGPANAYDEAHAMAVDGSGNVFVTGSSYHSWGLNADYATIAYSGAGTPLWANCYNGPGNDDDNAYAVAVDGNSNVFVTGSSYGGGGINADYLTIAYSGAGTPLWTNRYNGPGNDDDNAYALAVDADGNVLVTGSSAGVNGDSDYATIKYSGAGMPLWTNRYDGPGNSRDCAYAVAVDGNGNVFVTGTSSSGSSADYATIKYSGEGVPLWTNRYNGPANRDDSPLGKQSLALGPHGSVYVTGASDGSYSGGAADDFATVKYIFGPRLTLEADATGGFFIHLDGAPNVSYRLQRASGVTGAWSNLATNTAPASGLIEYHDTSPLPGQAFYRAAQP